MNQLAGAVVRDDERILFHCKKCDNDWLNELSCREVTLLLFMGVGVSSDFINRRFYSL